MNVSTFTTGRAGALPPARVPVEFRRRIESAIERLIAALDAMECDEDLGTDILDEPQQEDEHGGDILDEPHDDDADREPSLGWLASGVPSLCTGDDRELDSSDDEHSGDEHEGELGWPTFGGLRGWPGADHTGDVPASSGAAVAP